MGNAAGTAGHISPHSEEGCVKQTSLSESQQDSLAKKLNVPQSDVLLLYEHFLQFGPDAKGLVNKTVFEQPPFSSDPFCRQVWMRIPNEKGYHNTFSFISFAKTMAWWNSATQKAKLKVLFSWMKDDNGLPPSALARILAHTEMGLSVEELELMAKLVVELMIDQEREGPTQSASAMTVSATSFMNWCERMPQAELSSSLEFKISNSNQLHSNTDCSG